MKDKVTRKNLLSGQIDMGLYRLCPPSQSHVAAFLATLEEWHNRLGHSNYPTIRALIRQFQLPCSINKIPSDRCEACCLGKMHCISLPMTFNRSTRPPQLIHFDVWGPVPMCSSTGERYITIFIDDFSLFTWLFLIKNKSDVPSIFHQFQKMVENQLQ